MDSNDTIRRRINPNDPSHEKVTITTESQPKPTSSSISISTILKTTILTLLLSSALSWFITGDSLTWGYSPWWINPSIIKSKINGPISLTEVQLLTYNGEDPSKPIYLALNGTIYDVSAGANTYGPGGSYHFFAGKDAARAFITGCFQDDLTSDLRGVEEMYIPLDDPEGDAQLTKTELKIRREREKREARKRVKEGIEGWAKVFRGETGRPYFLVGKVKKDEGELGPVRELCEAAKGSRPKRGEEDGN